MAWFEKPGYLERLDIYTLAFLLILALAALVRLHQLGQPYLWQDEIYGAWASKNFLEGHGFSYPVGEGYPYHRALLTYLLPMTLSFSVLGYTEFAARLPSVIMGLSAIAVVYLLGKDLGGEKLGLIASGMMALDLWVIMWHTQARMYAHSQFLYLLGVWLVYRWYGRDRLALHSRYLYLLIPTLVLGVHNSEPFLGIVPVIGVFLVSGLLSKLTVPGWRNQIRENTFVRRHILWIAIGGLIGSFYMVLDGWQFIHSLMDYAPVWYQRGRGFLYYFWFLAENTGLHFLFGLGFALSWMKKDNWILPLAFLVPFVFQSMLYFKEPRLIFHLYPLFLLMCAVPLVYLLNTAESFLRSKDVLPGRAGMVSILAVFLVLAALYVPVQDLEPKGENHREPVKFISGKMSEDDILLSSAPSITGWYMGGMEHVDYDLNYLDNRNVSGELRDPKIGLKAPRNGAAMERIISENSGWVIADDNFYARHKIRGDVKQVIVENSRRIENKSWSGVKVYRFR
ncbi:MAG: ArnT family glycosyltransferase [Candidatus Nanohaloarchaea archaeon]